MEELLRQYGYLLLFGWTFIEGETVLLVAAYLASRGYLDIWMTMAVAAIGTFLGDQLYFWLGRRLGRDWFWQKERKWTKSVTRVLELIHRWDAWFILSYRFFYGVRNVSSFAFGLSKLSFMRFMVLNFIAAFIWAASFSVAGYFFGKAVEKFLGQAQEYEMAVLGGLAGLALAIGLIRWLKGRRASATGHQTPDAPQKPM
ncbi:MAG: DedA family protein [Magnetococcales bacterium]|nr:DedA family protein [Magnetococcales bacterium]MBF0420313.1 DedA family protein [Magnetococcales bacterium]MBF0435617.1 DedA family protein [Magnetococcales bacterium]